MRVSLLYSGGKDSSLAAWMLHRLGYRVELVTASFGYADFTGYARESARAIGFEHRVMNLGTELLRRACERIARDGFPRRGLEMLHLAALEALAEKGGAIADGTRRDDRVPLPSLDEIRSIEERYGVAYIAPLRGFGKRSIEDLTSRIFRVEHAPSEASRSADYEMEVRAYLRDKGYDVNKIFPPHVQSRVTGLR
ncbi:MAG: hypothetical protein GXO66_04545 [Euryarchaeota archaeon]|nr:hypothetical protein [Euryarchaeota archaeon]